MKSQNSQFPVLSFNAIFDGSTFNETTSHQVSSRYDGKLSLVDHKIATVGSMSICDAWTTAIDASLEKNWRRPTANYIRRTLENSPSLPLGSREVQYSRSIADRFVIPICLHNQKKKKKVGVAPLYKPIKIDVDLFTIATKLYQSNPRR